MCRAGEGAQWTGDWRLVDTMYWDHGLTIVARQNDSIPEKAMRNLIYLKTSSDIPTGRIFCDSRNLPM